MFYAIASSFIGQVSLWNLFHPSRQNENSQEKKQAVLDVSLTTSSLASSLMPSWFKKGSSDCRGVLEKAASSNVTSSAMSFSKTALSMSRRFLTYHVWMAGSAIKGLKRDLYIYTWISSFTQFFIQKNCIELFLSAHFLFWEILNLNLPFAVFAVNLSIIFFTPTNHDFQQQCSCLY